MEVVLRLSSNGRRAVAADSRALVEGIARRDALMGWVALLSPPLAAERWLTRLQRLIAAVTNDIFNAFAGFTQSLTYPMLFGARVLPGQHDHTASIQPLRVIYPCP